MAEEVIVGNKVVMKNKVILLIGQTLSELRYVEIDTTAHIAWRARPGHREGRMDGLMLGKFHAPLRTCGVHCDVRYSRP